MIEGAVKYNVQNVKDFYDLKQAMDNRQITYNCIDAQYMLEDIYPTI